ncbi:type IV pilus modification protein PilV [Lysobacter enzymogenes]|uniref:type IV pilus modification protein PilV n=1 Tax=Lysobacter enzymogenes TaxID=69 RepID=UPI001A969609|nr:type IV pilus modification protein PilV [Lysobacter enzymogenes]QQP98069.1 type IV pilus modification protein PilV [Lysobacter enzymogenes]
MNARVLRRGAVRRPRSQRGLSLIEVLISVLVLGMGLLGLAMLQTTNLRLAQSSNQRTIATNLGSDLLDDIRSNRLLAAQYGGTYLAKDSAQGANCSQLNTLTPAQRKDAYKCRLREALGENAVTRVTVRADNTIRIEVEWSDEKRWNPDAAVTNFWMESAL